MEPIDISSSDSESSEWDLEQYKIPDDLPISDSATSASDSRAVRTLASSSGASYAGKEYL